MAKLSSEDVLKLARLSKLELNDEQLERFRGEIESIMEYVEQLQLIDVSGLEPTSQVSGLTNSMRPDEIQEYQKPAELLKNASVSEDGHIKTKRIII
jgi:aspartyl-tRNA(Asn)/glutamyl-tRNA(Gln) amidotransferase subunit C